MSALAKFGASVCIAMAAVCALGAYVCFRGGLATTAAWYVVIVACWVTSAAMLWWLGRDVARQKAAACPMCAGTGRKGVAR